MSAPHGSPDRSPPTPQAGELRAAAAFLRANLPLSEVEGTGVRLHLAGPRSRLARLVAPGGAPYWAHAWPGGVALALHLAARPGVVQGRIVWDLGAGSGLVAIAALRAGAAAAVAIDPDPLARVAIRLNARANGVALRVRATGPELCQAPAGDAGHAVLAGDVFYDRTVAERMAAALDVAARLLPPDAPILVGDIGRAQLPLDRLEPIAAFPVRDLGDPPATPSREGRVYRWRPP